jgi:hypothetical protein
MGLADELKNALEFPHEGVDARLRTLSYNWTEDGLTVTGNFHYLAFRDGQPSVEEFVKLIYDRIVYFCLPRKERQRQLAKYEEKKDLRHLQDMFDKAKRLLIQAKEQKKTLGEPGELILFILLEVMRKAPQIACKMYLKTSEEMPVHGSDGIHVTYDEPTKTLALYWGESKIYSDLPKALDEICSSITTFTSLKDGKVPRHRDIDILKDHMDIQDASTREAILEYFDPYSEKHNNLREVYACFVGFDFSFFDKLRGMDKAAVEKAFEEAYLGRVRNACELFAGKIRDGKLTAHNFHFFLIPFPCVATLRKLYLGHLGVSDD